jgi:hypothetical protein
MQHESLCRHPIHEQQRQDLEEEDLEQEDENEEVCEGAGLDAGDDSAGAEGEEEGTEIEAHGF